MHEKTLLYGALGFTALAAIYGVVHGTRAAGNATTEIQISPVSQIDAKTLSSAEVPIRLTSSDGTGLRLQSLRANAVVEDPLALTEMHLVFENPESRVLEGTFRITLPQGASLSRFAMKVNGVWQEGEVVEKQAARRAYEDFLHRKQDPALMEQGAGNEFSARVFPIPANGIKEIMIAYSETIEAGAPYVLPLRGLPQLGTLDVDVHAAGARGALTGGRSDATFSLHQQRFTPAQDFVVDARQLPRSAGLRAGDLAIARVVPFATSRPEPIASAVVLVDTSASRGLGLPDQARVVRGVLGRMNPDASVTVACFDQEVAPIYEGKAGAFGDKEVNAIIARGALGASDFEQALGWAGEQAKKAKAKRVVIVGDGVATAGETDGQKLKEKVERLREAGVERMDAVAMGGIRDDAFLRTIVRGVLDRDGVVLDAKLGIDALARRLGEATSSGVPVKVEGASWSWPQTLDGLQAGDEIMVYAQIDSTKPVKIAIGTQQFAPDLRSSDRPLVERAWAQAKIQSLVDAPTDTASVTKAQIIALSTSHRVMSPYTAMLVLETDNDYRRFGIDRNATVDILTVKDGRIAVDHQPRAWEQRQAELEKSKLKEEAKNDKGFQAPPPPVMVPQTTVTATAAAPAAAPMASAAPGYFGAPADETLGATTTRERNLQQAPRGGDAEQRGPGSAADRSGALDLQDPWAANDGRAVDLGLNGTGGGGGGEGQGVGRAAGQAAGGLGGHAAGAAAHGTPPPARPSRPDNRRARPSGDPLSAEADDIPQFRAPGPAPTVSARAVTPPQAQVRPGALVVQGGIGQDEVQRVVRAATPRLRACYTRQIQTNPSAGGHVDLSVVVDSLGEVKTADATSTMSSELKTCMAGVFRTLRFPAPGTGNARFTASFDLVPSGDAGEVAQNNGNGNVPKAAPYDGRFKVVMDRLSQGDKDGGLDEAKRWQTDQPGDIMALVALGEAYEARGDLKTAARAYGSILELFSFRADSRRFAGERLERLGEPSAVRLAADTYGKAAEQRPDHPASHRLFAFTLLKAGEHEKAFEAMKKGAMRSYPAGRFAGADRILKEDLGLIASVWAAAAPARRGEIMTKLHAAGGAEENAPSLRFVLVWETDANDVDFHIHDGKGGHAYYGNRQLASGGELYADVTTGYGPECFTIRGARDKRAYPYTLQAHYYSRGPMGYGMGKLEVLEHDGKGHVSFDERPFVVMVDRAYVDLGSVDKPKGVETASLK
ncbi:MAG TPA: VIT domain-containing protein [Labilithrix sp.]|nr:VIT domain-containing protein [Labilithrix sp.]